MSGSFVLTQGAGQKLEFAVNRNNGGVSDVEWLSAGDNFAKIMQLASGAAELVMKPIAQAVKKLFEDMLAITVVINKKINIKKALSPQDTKGLWISAEFANLLKLAGIAPEAVTMKPRKLTENANDTKIKTTLPAVHELDPTHFCYMLATELNKVMNGEPSEVLSKDRWCLFYVAGFAVRVDWGSGRAQWRVFVWSLGGSTWYRGDVVFACN